MTPEEYKKLQAQRQKKVDAVIAHNKAAAAAIQACNQQESTGALSTNGLSACIAANGAQNLPSGIDVVVADKPKPGQVTLTPQQVALQAVATLQLPSPKPGIGPPPSINPWKMAAVGYPLWLWGDGNMDPGRVSSKVANLTVALDAHVERITFDMGDGHTISCTSEQARHPWHRGIVRPGTPSPFCGYRYTKPSLPHGTYTVTAYTHYKIGWTINGKSGTEDYVPPPASVQLPVGEIQVTVR